MLAAPARSGILAGYALGALVRWLFTISGVTVAALIGGLHLSGPAFEPIIPPTVAALVELAPEMLVPGHCSGWRAQHALAAALPDAWVSSSSGSRYTLTAA